MFGKLIVGGGGEEEAAALLQGGVAPGEPGVEAGEVGGGEDSNDLREHVVGILFSRSKLTHLQRLVSGCWLLVLREKLTLASRNMVGVIGRRYLE